MKVLAKPGKNTLAYFSGALVATKKKSFIRWALQDGC